VLEQVDLDWSPAAADSDAGRFIRNAQRRIEQFQSENERIPGFEASNFHAAAGLLQAIQEQRLAPGLRFCEWGSGFGVVTCLAAMAGFDAWGIETEAKLVGSSRQLALDYDLDVIFQQGSYKPDLTFGSDLELPTESAESGRFPFDCDVVYIYPWPAEKAIVTQRFEQMAQPGALLVSYQGGGRFRIQRASTDSGSG